LLPTVPSFELTEMQAEVNVILSVNCNTALKGSNLELNKDGMITLNLT